MKRHPQRRAIGSGSSSTQLPKQLLTKWVCTAEAVLGAGDIPAWAKTTLSSWGLHLNQERQRATWKEKCRLVAKWRGIKRVSSRGDLGIYRGRGSHKLWPTARPRSTGTWPPGHAQGAKGRGRSSRRLGSPERTCEPRAFPLTVMMRSTERAGDTGVSRAMRCTHVGSGYEKQRSKWWLQCRECWGLKRDHITWSPKNKRDQTGKMSSGDKQPH